MLGFPGNLLLNTNARISVLDTNTPPAFEVSAPVRSGALTTNRITAHSFPDAHAFLTASVLGESEDLTITDQGLAELVRVGLLAPASELPQTVHYHLPVLSAEVGPSDRQQPSPMPHVLGLTEYMNRIPDSYVPDAWRELPIGLIRDAPSGLLSPVLIAGTSQPTSSQGWDVAADDVPETRLQFDRDGFAVLCNLIPEVHVRALGQYFNSLAQEGYMHCQKEGGAHRYYMHNDPVASFWHQQLNHRISRLTGCATKPSYSFASLYVEGGDLAWHTDRSACEFTVTLLMDYAPVDQDGASPWLLKIRGRDGQIHEMKQRVGDALVFKGRELEHSRDILPAGHRSASLLFHFVHADYEGPLV